MDINDTKITVESLNEYVIFETALEEATLTIVYRRGKPEEAQALIDNLDRYIRVAGETLAERFNQDLTDPDEFDSL